jgi:hypothetical protein
MFEINDTDKEILVSLEQYDRRREKDQGKSNYTIGTTIMKVRLNSNICQFVFVTFYNC